MSGEPAVRSTGPAPAPGSEVGARSERGTARGVPGSGRPGAGRLFRRAGWNLGDQMLSAVTNAALSFLVARSVDARGFGAFAVAFGVFTVLIGVERALVGQPLNIRYSAVTGDELRDAFRRGLGTVLGVTAAVALGCVAAGLALGGVLRPTLVSFGLVLPALTLQDACRLSFFTQAKPQLATLNDALWAVLQFGAMAVLIGTGRATPWSLILAWGGSAAACSAFGLVQLRVLPAVGSTGAWLREHRDLVGYLVAEFLLGAGALQGGIFLVGALIGLSDLGSLRAAQTLTGPLGVVFAAAMTFGLPEVSRRVDLSASMRWKLSGLMTAVMTTGSLVYAGLLMLIPGSLGRTLLGDSWPGAQRVLLPVALVSAGVGACLGPVIVILALGRTRATFRLTVVEAVMVVGGMLIGARLGGAPGAAWALCIQQFVLVPLWFLTLRGVLRGSGAGRLRRPPRR